MAAVVAERIGVAGLLAERQHVGGQPLGIVRARRGGSCASRRARRRCSRSTGWPSAVGPFAELDERPSRHDRRRRGTGRRSASRSRTASRCSHPALRGGVQQLVGDRQTHIGVVGREQGVVVQRQRLRRRRRVAEPADLVDRRCTVSVGCAAYGPLGRQPHRQAGPPAPAHPDRAGRWPARHRPSMRRRESSSRCSSTHTPPKPSAAAGEQAIVAGALGRLDRRSYRSRASARRPPASTASAGPGATLGLDGRRGRAGRQRRTATRPRGSSPELPRALQPERRLQAPVDGGPPVAVGAWCRFDEVAGPPHGPVDVRAVNGRRRSGVQPEPPLGRDGGHEGIADHPVGEPHLVAVELDERRPGEEPSFDVGRLVTADGGHLGQRGAVPEDRRRAEHPQLVGPQRGQPPLQQAVERRRCAATAGGWRRSSVMKSGLPPVAVSIAAISSGAAAAPRHSCT